MSSTLLAPRPLTEHLLRTSLVLALLLPWFLLHVPVGVEIGFDVIDLCFLLRCALDRDWRWLTTNWVPIGLAWWAWAVLCTIIAASPPAALLQSVLVIRFLILAAALEQWTLEPAAARRWFGRSLGFATLYVALQTLLQFATGHNLFGAPRSGDGELTGPFTKPRAGPTYVRMLFPVLVPAGCRLLDRAWWAGLALFAAAMAVDVLIGQRMPVLLAVLGLILMALLLPRLRAPVLVALVAGAALISASVVISPPTFYRLVTKFSRQMEDFPDSPYGQIAARSLAIIEQHPLVGRGYDGFQSGCALPRYFAGWHWPGHPATDDGGGAKICVTHPHSLYLQAATDAGLPGLLLFCALVAAWLARLGRGLLRHGDPLRVGLFVAAAIQLFPIASTSPIISIPIGGWFFLLLGYGLAESRHHAIDRQVRQIGLP